MAASSMSVRSLSRLSHLSRTLLFVKPQRRLGSYNLTTAAENNVAGEKTSSKTEDSNTKPDKKTEEAKKAETSDIKKKLKEENEKLKAEVKDFKDKYMRSLAETENTRIRLRKQIEEARIFGIQGFSKDLLEVADILNKATETVPEDQIKSNEHLKSLYEGLQMTNKQMLKVFSKHGLEKIDPAVGDKFDPHYHEALFQVPAQEKQEGNTVAIIEKTGYKLHDRTLRPALVGVFKS